MATGLTLIEEHPVYIREVEGEWVNRQYVETLGSTKEISGIVKHQRRGGNVSTPTPEGVRINDTRMLLTEEEIVTVEDMDFKPDSATVVYLEDPDTNPSAIPYLVYSQKPQPPVGFTLISANEYLIIRKDRYKL